jgi:hypothetical protein
VDVGGECDVIIMLALGAHELTDLLSGRRVVEREAYRPESQSHESGRGRAW